MKRTWRNLIVLLVGLVLPCLWSAGCSKGDQLSALLQEADEYYAEAKLEEAEIVYKNALRLAGTNTHANARLALIYFDQGKPLMAYSALRYAKGLDPDNLQVRAKLGISLYNGRKFQDAREEARYILAKEPTNEEALMLLADTGVETNDLAEVIREFEALREKAGETVGFQVGWATLLMRQKQADEAEATLKSALLAGPKSAAAHASLGNLYALRGNTNEALRFLEAAADLSPARSYRRLRYADYKMQTGAVEEGKAYLAKMTEETPDYLPAWYRRAELALVAKDYDACQTFVERILSQDNTHFDGQMMMARLRMAKGQPDLAIATFERIQSMFPLPQVAYQRALAHLSKNETANAMAQLNLAVELDPNYTDALLLRSEMLLNEGETASVVLKLTELIQRLPGDLRAHLLLARAQRMRGNLDEALAVYGRLAQMYPKNGQIQHFRGLVLLQQEKLDEAAETFRKALELEPTLLPALERLVDIDISGARKQYEEARKRIAAISEDGLSNRDKAMLQLLLAKTYNAERNYDEAEKLALRALEIEPELTSAQLFLMDVYIGGQKTEKALEELQSVRQERPRDLTVLLRLGMVLEVQQKFEEAREVYEAMLAIDPRIAVAFNNLAMLYADRLGDLTKAYEFAVKARELTPNSPFSADTLGWILFKRGEFGRARGLLEESRSQFAVENPVYLPEVHYHLGMVHYMSGEEAKAREYFEKAREGDLKFANREDVTRRLEILQMDPGQATPQQIERMVADLARVPGDPVLAVRLGAALEAAGQWQQADEIYAKANEANPNNVPILFRWAELKATHLSDQVKAIELAKKAQALSPQDAGISFTLGRLAFLAGDTLWSLSLLQESARQRSGDPDVLFYLAQAQLSQGQLPAARDNLSRAMKQNPAPKLSEEAASLLNLVEAALNTNQLNAVAAILPAILQGNPNHVLALYLSGLLLEQKGSYKEAADVYNRILALPGYPNFHPAERQWALLLLERFNATDEGYGRALKVREHYPSDPMLAKALGKVDYQRKNYARAVQLLQQATRGLPSDAEAYYVLGFAQQQVQQVDAGKLALTKALELDPNHPMAEQARQTLAPPNP